MAFIRQSLNNGLHHASVRLDNWNEVLGAADTLSKRKVPRDLGPTRHGVTRGGTIYFLNPSGRRNEAFSGGQFWHPDKTIITWTEVQHGPASFYHDRKFNRAFLSVSS
jgi:catechol 2,3-dioxygenase